MLWRLKGRIFEWRQKHGDADPLVFLLVFLLCIAVPAMLIALRDDASRDTRQAGDRNEARDEASRVPGRQTLPDPNAPVRRGDDVSATPARALTPTGGATGQGQTGGASEPTGGGTEPVSDDAPAPTPRRRGSEDPSEPTPTVPTETEAAPAPAPQVVPAPAPEAQVEQPVEPPERPDREDRGGAERPDKEKKSPGVPVEEGD